MQLCSISYKHKPEEFLCIICVLRCNKAELRSLKVSKVTTSLKISDIRSKARRKQNKVLFLNAPAFLTALFIFLQA